MGSIPLLHILNLDIDGHHGRYLLKGPLVLDELPEFFVADFAVGVLVQVVDGLVDNLLELSVGQVLSRHHLQHLEVVELGKTV